MVTVTKLNRCVKLPSEDSGSVLLRWGCRGPAAPPARPCSSRRRTRSPDAPSSLWSETATNRRVRPTGTVIITTVDITGISGPITGWAAVHICYMLRVFDVSIFKEELKKEPNRYWFLTVILIFRDWKIRADIFLSDKHNIDVQLFYLLLYILLESACRGSCRLPSGG